MSSSLSTTTVHPRLLSSKPFCLLLKHSSRTPSPLLTSKHLRSFTFTKRSLHQARLSFTSRSVTSSWLFLLTHFKPWRAQLVMHSVVVAPGTNQRSLSLAEVSAFRPNFDHNKEFSLIISCNKECINPTLSFIEGKLVHQINHFGITRPRGVVRVCELSEMYFTSF